MGSPPLSGSFPCGTSAQSPPRCEIVRRHSFQGSDDAAQGHGVRTSPASLSSNVLPPSVSGSIGSPAWSVTTAVPSR